MSRPIRWLHLSDLHYGCKGVELWQQVERDFLKDLDAVQERAGGAPDLLLFTGDLAFSGQDEEYAAVERFLDRVVQHFDRPPLLVPVPGNHDVQRPKPGREARLYHVLKSFDGTVDDDDVRGIYDELWQQRDASFIEDLFPGYVSFFGRRVRGRLEAGSRALHLSHFPCDFTAVVEPEGAFPLALVGLNSSWIQYTGGDFDGRLLLPLQQFSAALAPKDDEEPYGVFYQAEQALLLMHQPPSWLSPVGREIFDEEIYTPERFTACLFGHMHGASSTAFQSAGGAARVLIQSPSLFGLEKWGTSQEERAFGYSWGQIREDGEIRFWPRELRRRGDGARSFGHDPGFHEDPDGVLLRPGTRSTQGVAVEHRGIDIRGYLDWLLPKVETLEMRGIAGDRSHSALRPPIEELYTPLRLRGGLARAVDDPAEIGLERAEQGGALQSILQASERALIEGDPGAGKTTFLRFVATMLGRDAAGRPCLAGGSWCRTHLGFEPEGRPLPIFLRLAGLVRQLRQDENGADGRGRLLDLLRFELEESDRGELYDRAFWQDQLERGDAWLLLDGLDEVADPALRERLFAVVRDAAEAWKAKIVVASRPFQTEQLSAMGFRVAVVEPFRDREITTFLAFWTAALHRQERETAAKGEAGRYRQRLEEAILTRPKVKALARNPVMLTCLCVVHWNRGDLPQVRSRVYEAVIHWLLHARAPSRRRRFDLEPDQAQRALARLALYAMTTGEGKQSILGLGDAVRELEAICRRFWPDVAPADLPGRIHSWLLFEGECSGVVEELAGERLRFWHLTFQEFLAALELARGEKKKWWRELETRFVEAQWRETTELFTTCLYDLGQLEQVDGLLRSLLEQGGYTQKLAAEARVVGVIGRLLPPLEVCGYRPALELRAAYEQALGRTMAIFTLDGSAQVPIGDRIAAAEALGRGGDPRLRHAADNFLPVPGTEILLGRFPVTVEEYQRFVDERGYEDPRWWGKHWKVKDKNGWDEPGEWGDQLETPNRPVVGVSWFEALAYCAWFSDLRGTRVRLPLEQEWQEAATHPAGEYAWGDSKPGRDLANFGRKVGAPTSVGFYPRGRGRHGHLDLGGNVWEWCLGELDNGEFRPLRGGCWLSDASGLRSAFRVAYWPRRRHLYVGFRVCCLPPSP